MEDLSERSEKIITGYVALYKGNIRIPDEGLGAMLVFKAENSDYQRIAAYVHDMNMFYLHRYPEHIEPAIATFGKDMEELSTRMMDYITSTWHTLRALKAYIAAVHHAFTQDVNRDPARTLMSLNLFHPGTPQSCSDATVWLQERLDAPALKITCSSHLEVQMLRAITSRYAPWMLADKDASSGAALVALKSVFPDAIAEPGLCDRDGMSTLYGNYTPKMIWTVILHPTQPRPTALQEGMLLKGLCVFQKAYLEAIGYNEYQPLPDPNAYLDLAERAPNYWAIYKNGAYAGRVSALAATCSPPGEEPYRNTLAEFPMVNARKNAPAARYQLPPEDTLLDIAWLHSDGFDRTVAIREPALPYYTGERDFDDC